MNRLLFVLAVLSFAALAGEVPNLALTPGVARTDLTVQVICKKKWGKDARVVTQAMKMQVFKNYGLSGNNDPSCKLDAHGRRFEIDHLVSRELGGADDVRNLWPQCYRGTWGASVKDKLENRLHRELCAGRVTLDAAHRMIINDWRVAYRRYYGEPK